jgi:hypothetical protein
VTDDADLAIVQAHLGTVCAPATAGTR